MDNEGGEVASSAMSTVVTSTNDVPVVVERVMWWPGPTPATWVEGHNSFGDPAQIVVERAVYSDVGGMFWAAGTNAVATRLE